MVKFIKKQMFLSPMIKDRWDSRYDVKTVSAKLTQADFVKFKIHCERKGVSPSREIKTLIEQEINNPLSQNIAGSNIFVYNAARDNFSWRAILDKDVTAHIEDNISPEFLYQLKEAVDSAIEYRETLIQKKDKESVAIPGKIVRRGL